MEGVFMPKTFYTERDIEDMVAKGDYSLMVDENVVLTALAFEKAERLGVKLLQPHQTPPAAPIRPYLSEPSKKESSPGQSPEPLVNDALRQRIRKAVKAKLGDQINDALIETIITRVLNNIEVS
jgi:hypothetical protein